MKMNKYVILFSIFVLTGCAMYNAEDHDNNFRLNIFNSSWNTSRIYIHCAENGHRMSIINNPTFSTTTSKVVRLNSGCWSIYLVVSGHGRDRQSDSRSVLPNEDICVVVTQTMDVRWGVCPITDRI